MHRQMLLNISLTPVIKYDDKTDQYIIYFEEFPQAIAVGDTEADAEKRLGYLVEDMWKERSDELKQTLLNNYLNDSRRNKDINARLVRHQKNFLIMPKRITAR